MADGEVALPNQVPLAHAVRFEASAPNQCMSHLNISKVEPITTFQDLAEEMNRQLAEQRAELKQLLSTQVGHLEAEMKRLVQHSRFGARSRTFGENDSGTTARATQSNKSQAVTVPSERVFCIKTETGETMKVQPEYERVSGIAMTRQPAGIVPHKKSVASGFRLKNTLFLGEADPDARVPGCFVNCHQICARIVMSRYFELVTISIILLNTFQIGALAGWQVENVGKTLPVFFRYSKVMFTCMFTIELIIRVVSEGFRYLSIHNKHLDWNLFDLLLVLASWIEEILHDSAAPQISALRVLRLLRLVKVLRIIRVMRFFRDLRIIVYGMLSSARSLLWCFLLILLLTFMWTLVVLQVLVEELPSRDQETRELLVSHFGGTARCMYTMFLAITGGLDWGAAAEPLNKISPILGVLFMIYVGINIFCVFNVVTCVFVDKANQFTKSDIDHVVMEEMTSRQAMIEDMKAIFEEADSDTNFSLTLKEFTLYIHDARVQSYFRKLGLNVERDSAIALFHLIDIDRSGYITLEEFVDGCSQFVGGARQLDIARLQHDCKVISWQLEAVLTAIKGQQAPEEESKVMHRLSAMPAQRNRMAFSTFSSTLQ
eukprot:TRINITY_DN30846_c0_g1_i1.p1 TRINITY_DN30846_c0_g1~~TRINITY_DN30846_c0_g1_i1.p1  ORF type:complete len:602 (+),score=94.35 TRINITY_DN30846_c0_g1_i1:50-1855(+)